MPFSKSNLIESWFYELELEKIGVVPARIPDRNQKHSWPCAVDYESNTLFTQLISSSAEMREGEYYYLLAIEKNLFLIMSDDYNANFITKEFGNFSFNYLVNIVNQAVKVVVLGKEKFSFLQKA